MTAMPPQHEEILPALYFIQRGYLNANHFAYRSEAPVLIDTGYRGDWPITRSLLTDLGLDLDRTALIINTHTHCDHVGGNHAIQDRSGCAIALHPRGMHFMQERDDRSPWWSFYHQEADFFQPTESLEDGQVVRVGRYPFEVIHTPGHASDGLVLYCRSERLLLSSDTLWERDFPVMTVAVEGEGAVDTMLTSLAKIATLEVARVFPGHGAPFTGFKKALERAVVRLERYQGDLTLVGWDVLKKIIVYTIMMRRRVPRERFYDQLLATTWFPETVDRYFEGRGRSLYNAIMTDFERRGVVRREGPCWITTVPP
jgi:glyoxylase-like metal-dependent hydrolase (beta-lactamase superfamily II)